MGKGNKPALRMTLFALILVSGKQFLPDIKNTIFSEILF